MRSSLINYYYQKQITMTTFLQSAPYYYIELVLWIMLTFVTVCILSIELWTYCYKLCLRKFLQNIESNNSDSTSMPSSSPSIQNTTSNISGKKIHYLQPTYLFPLLSYLFYLITSITGFVSMFHSHDHHYICHWTIIIGTMSYPLGKMWMYLVFIYRLYIVYIDSIFEYNRKLIIGMMSAVVFYSLTLAIVNTLTVSDIT
eukprot:301179_1